MEMAKNHQIVLGGLGRPFTLGMLYNAPKDKLIPGVALWDSKTLKGLTDSRPQRSSNFDVRASDSTSDSSFNLNVDASLKLSFMSGTIEVGGSANYLNDKKEFKNQCRVTLQYQATTHFEQLCLTEKERQVLQSSELREGLATHVVTGIEYGANAFFVFDSQKVESSNVQTVKGEMEATIKKIPSCDIEGKVKIDLTDAEKKLSETFSVKFYGDFLLETNPATFNAAVQTYVDLPKLLRGDSDKEPVNTVPMRVWLLPLEVLTHQDPPVTKGISVGLVLEAERTLEDMSSIKMRCNDVLSAGAVGKFPQLHLQLHMFDRLCHYYTVELQRKMAEMCLAIREGKEPECKLRILFEERHDTPFSQGKLTQWLDDKEREINVVQFCLDIMKGVPVQSTESMVDSFVMDPEKHSCTGFIFTSLGNSDQQIQGMEQYIDALKGAAEEQEPVQTKGQSDDTPWFRDNAQIVAMREMATDFITKKKSSSLFVAAFQVDKGQGSALYLYNRGVCASPKEAEALTS